MKPSLLVGVAVLSDMFTPRWVVAGRSARRSSTWRDHGSGSGVLSPSGPGGFRARWATLQRRLTEAPGDSRTDRQDSRLHLDPGPLVVVLVLVAAVLHATWNAIAHTAADRLVGFALISTATFVMGRVVGLTQPLLDARDFGLVAVSAAIHVVYFVLLLASYHQADFNRAYP